MTRRKGKRKQGRRYTVRKAYDNCQIHHPDGTLLFLASEKMVDFYLSKNLGELISEGPPRAIKLNFVPKGMGHAGREFYLIPRKNHCAVCGATERLSKHHVVPECYRRYFEVKMKEGWSHDVLALCKECHDSYELKASEFKRRLEQKYDAPMQGRGFTIDHQNRRIKKLTNTYKKYSHLIPADKAVEIEQELKAYFQVGDLALVQQEQWDHAGQLPEYIRHPDFKSHGELVLESYEGTTFDFVVMWRKHFLETMNPQFLPQLWDVNHYVEKV